MNVHKQRMEALQAANRVRISRAKLRREVNTLPSVEGHARLVELLASPPAMIETMSVLDILQWPHRLGIHMALNFMRASRVPLDRTVAQLTERQREALGECLLGRRQYVSEEARLREFVARGGRAA